MGSYQTSKIYQVPQRNLPGWQIFLDGLARRVIDVLASFFGLLILTPWFFVIGIIIKHDTPGPVFYHGPRVGKGGKTFPILKFRTMYEAPASYNGARLTNHKDPRVTKIGRWLRDTKLNELPQLWNVLRGQMCLVGPRPEDPDIFADWPEEYQTALQDVKPGMTSPSSLIFFDEESKLTSAEVRKDYLENILPFKLQHDIHYLKHRSIINDLDVIFLTLIALIPRMREKRINSYVVDKGPLISLFYDFINWFLIDLVVSIFATTVAIGIWRLSAPINVGFLNALLLAYLLAFIFSMTNVAFGLNRIAWRHARAEATLDVALSTTLTTLVIAILDMLDVFPVTLPMGVVIMAGMLSFIGFVVTRYRERILTGMASRWLSWRKKEAEPGERVLILGAGDSGIRASWFIKHGYLEQQMNVVGFIDDDLYKEDLIIDGSVVLGKSTEMAEIVREHKIDLILFAIDNIPPDRCQELLSMCRATSAKRTVRFRSMIDTIESVIDPVEPGCGECDTAGEDLAALLDELDALLVQKDFDGARALVKQSQKNLSLSESE